MRNLISMVMIAVFVMAMTMPSYSHAMPSEHANQVEASEHADCHQANHANGAAKHKKEGSGESCCEKGMCKCANGGCHASVKVFGNGGAALFIPLSHEASFVFTGQHLTSAFLEGIQRPPRA